MLAVQRALGRIDERPQQGMFHHGKFYIVTGWIFEAQRLEVEPLPNRRRPPRTGPTALAPTASPLTSSETQRAPEGLSREGPEATGALCWLTWRFIQHLRSNPCGAA